MTPPDPLPPKPLSPEQWARIAELFNALVSHLPDTRPALLQRLCPDDPLVRSEIDRLLAEHERLTHFLETPAHPNPFSSTLEFRQTYFPGQLLANRYQVVQLLGRGGMGEVYLVDDQELGEEVALKTLPAAHALTGELKARFKREILLARRIHHPNVCRIHDLGFEGPDPDSRTLFLTMEYIRGVTLSELLQQNGPCTPETALTFVRQIAGALDAAHDLDIVHRDLKSSNIMVESNSRSGAVCVKVTDFGLARALDDEHDLSFTVHGGFVGTPAYAAPEQFSGQATPQTDIYSLGVVIFEMLTASRPFPSGTPVEARGAHLQDPAFKTIPEPWERVILKCLEPFPADRFARASEVSEALEPAAPSAPPPPLLTRRGVLVASGATAALAVGGGFAFRERVRNWFSNLINPLPAKCFVALLSWPPTPDSHIAALLAWGLSNIESALARAEPSHRNLLVLSTNQVDLQGQPATEPLQLCEALGANLFLALSGSAVRDGIELVLQLRDAAAKRLLRERKLRVAREDTSAGEQLASVAAHMLQVALPRGATGDIGLHSANPTAQGEYQAAEALMRDPNYKEIDQAIDHYKNALEADPAFAQAGARLAYAYVRLYFKKKEPATLDLAKRNADAALRLNPNLIDAILASAMVQSSTGHQTDALTTLSTALRIDPLNTHVLEFKGHVFERLNRWTEAQKVYRRVINERPNYWPAYNELGRSFAKAGNYSEAAKAFSNATVAAPGCSLAFNNLGAMYLDLGRFQDAAANFDRSIQLYPNADAYSNTATAFFDLGNYTRAAEDYKKALELKPRDEEIWRNLADCYSAMPYRQADAQQAYARAAAEAQHSLDTDPTDGTYWIKLALYQLKAGTHVDARALLAKGEKLGATDVASQTAKAQILALLGDRKAALSTLIACLKKGATDFDFSLISDFRELRASPEYKRALAQTSHPA